MLSSGSLLGVLQFTLMPIYQKSVHSVMLLGERIEARHESVARKIFIDMNIRKVTLKCHWLDEF